MAEIRSLDLELEAVTPLWIGGAGARAELRAPSVRGCLRFWFRALAGGLLGESLELMRAAEGAVFGNTSQASSVAVRLTGSVKASPTVVEAIDQLPGLSYMFWSVLGRQRDAILPGEKFRLRLQARPWLHETIEAAGRKLSQADRFDLAAASIWLLLRLGGVGARSRRAGGGMTATASPQNWPTTLPPLVSTATTPAELAAELGQGIGQIRQLFGWTSAPAGTLSSFDILHDKVSELQVVEKTFASWYEAVNWAGERFQAFRREFNLDASGVAGLLLQGKLAVQTIQRAVFGLPLAFFFKSMLADATAKGLSPRDARKRASATVTPSRGQARASPLYFRIARLAGQPARYAVLMGCFRSRFLPDDEMTIRPGDQSIRPVRISVPRDYTIIKQWFDYVRKQNTNLIAVPLASRTA